MFDVKKDALEYARENKELLKEAARRHKPTLSELANRNSSYAKPAFLQRFEGLTWNDILDEDEKKEFLAQEEPETKLAQNTVGNSMNTANDANTIVSTKNNYANNNYLVSGKSTLDPNWGQKTSKLLDNYLENYTYNPGRIHTGILAPYYDMRKNYDKMVKDDLIGADKFYHCKANYEAANRGAWGEMLGKVISLSRELYGLATGDPLSDSLDDWRADKRGWNGVTKGLSLKQACPTNPREYMKVNK